VREVLRYFVRHPGAADDVRGVAQWRLLNEFVTRTVDETQQALTWLVAQGYLVETATVGSGKIYSLHPDRAGDAFALLEDAPPGAQDSRG